MFRILQVPIVPMVPIVAAFSFVALAGQAFTRAPAAVAQTPSSSAGQSWALVAGSGWYVTAELGDWDGRYGLLRARSVEPRSWETFSLLTTDSTGDNRTVVLRSQANGRYVSAEVHDKGGRYGMLRARTRTVGSWEKFTLVSEGNHRFALRSQANHRYVSAELGNTGNRVGMLRARARRGGSWERLQLVKLPSAAAGAPTHPSPHPSGTATVMSWNLCSNNSECANYRATPAVLTRRVVTRAIHPVNEPTPQVMFFQEFCERYAKPLEHGLEAATGHGWDVRFAPTELQRGANTGITAQKRCQDDSSGADRGAFGVGLAVPDENAWYQRFALPSPNGKEQRPALCGTVDSMAADFCVAHFSNGGGSKSDDLHNTWRPRQARALLSDVAKPGFVSVFGGDLNTAPPDAPKSIKLPDLAPLYARYQECDQSQHGGRRTGDPTESDGAYKLDYIFGPKGAGYRPGCQERTSPFSDHRAVYTTVLHLHGN